MRRAKRRKFRGGQTATPAEERSERERYKKYMDILKSKFSIRDTLYDQMHYGFLNKKYEVIQPLSGVDTLRFGNYAPTVHGLNFVVDQYNEFRDFYLKFTQETGQAPPALISDLIPGKSFSNFDVNYQQYLTALVLRISDEIVKLVRQGRSASTSRFSPIEFYNYISEHVLFNPEFESFPISKSGYAISARSDVYQSGLYIDLSVESSVQRDESKGVMLSDPGFLCYLTFATQHGFSVDFNAPWRLVLNLEHEKTMTNILNGRPKEDYWHFYYDQYVENTGFSYDYNNIRDFYETLYKIYYRVYNNLTVEEANRLQWDSLYRDIFKQSLRSSSLGPGQVWVEIFTLNRLREVGLITTYQGFSENQRCLDIRSHAMQVYGEESEDQFGNRQENKIITGHVGAPTSGVSAYVTTACAEILKEKITKVDS